MVRVACEAFHGKRRSVLVVHVAQTGEMKEAYKILFENLAKLLLDEGIKS
jgi:hypothetical protein